MSRKRRLVADEPYLIVRSLSSDVTSGTRIAAHAHPWHQLIYIGSGLMIVDTAQGAWIAPPSWAVWAPARAVHALRFTGASRLRTLYVRPDGARDLPAGCRSLVVSPLLRELVLRTVEIGMLDAREPVEAAMAAVILAELDSAGPPPFRLPQPSSAATIAAARLLADEACDLPAVARKVGLGTRTLERRFRAETGMTLGRWQQQRRLLTGMELIAAGAMVKTAAGEAGFASVSAYVAAFRKLFGTTPARYFDAR